MARHSVLQAFYVSKVWRDFRMTLILERGLRCEHCGEMVTVAKELTAHHEIELTPDNVHDHMISLNPKLVKLVHHRCHNVIHGRFGAKRGRSVYLVYGPPLAGKKTFVTEQMMRGDLVVDMDRLFEAVSFQPSYDKPDNLLSNVMGVHNLLLDNVKTRMGKWGNAWVIGGYADKFKRERTADMIGAELVFIDASQDECLARLEADSMRMHYVSDWRGYICKWFEQYQA
ncbi:HNH endonuclease [Cohnella herbarum]|uniref:HNH endonuclease n=1 Tax=Cohnella herbarum TaxID=2728023 RepID=A0A7Z2ZRC1_9BACL|nr:HNH endonuclease [Cohnella herbarum]QJD87892.1 HNH endonuclease [Cohnella herbarum]